MEQIFATTTKNISLGKKVAFSLEKLQIQYKISKKKDK